MNVNQCVVEFHLWWLQWCIALSSCCCWKSCKEPTNMKFKHRNDLFAPTNIYLLSSLISHPAFASSFVWFSTCIQQQLQQQQDTKKWRTASSSGTTICLGAAVALDETFFNTFSCSRLCFHESCEDKVDVIYCSILLMKFMFTFLTDYFHSLTFPLLPLIPRTRLKWWQSTSPCSRFYWTKNTKKKSFSLEERKSSLLLYALCVYFCISISHHLQQTDSLVATRRNNKQNSTEIFWQQMEMWATRREIYFSDF